MILITSTTLRAEVKKALLEKAYTDDEFRILYANFLDLQARRLKGLKLAALIVGFIFLMMPILSWLSPVSEQNGSVLLVVTAMNIPILLGILFLVYYLLFGRIKQQFIQAASVHYAHILQEKEA